MDESLSGAGRGHDPEVAAVRAARRKHGQELVEIVMAVVPGWVERSVISRLPPDRADDDEVRALVAGAAVAARAEGGSRLWAAVTREPGIDHGPAPLQVLRSLVRHPTDVLRSLGVAESGRSDFDRQAFPADVYDLSPATWADIDPALSEPGVAWGAATAHLHQLQQRAPEG